MRISLGHWSHLSELLLAFERCFESCARLDAYRVDGEGGDPHGSQRRLVEYRLNTLTHRMEHELDKLTAERLIAELTARKARDAAKTGCAA